MLKDLRDVAPKPSVLHAEQPQLSAFLYRREMFCLHNGCWFQARRATPLSNFHNDGHQLMLGPWWCPVGHAGVLPVFTAFHVASFVWKCCPAELRWDVVDGGRLSLEGVLE